MCYNDYRKREKEVIKMFVKVNQTQYGYDVVERFKGEHDKAKKVYKTKLVACPSGMRKHFLVWCENLGKCVWVKESHCVIA